MARVSHKYVRRNTCTTNGLSFSKAIATEGLSHSERHDYSATCGTYNGAQLGASVSCSSEGRHGTACRFRRSIQDERKRVDGAASSIEGGRIAITRQVSTVARANPGVICGQLDPILERVNTQLTTCHACSTSVIAFYV